MTDIHPGYEHPVQNIFDNFPIGFLVIDRSGTILQANQESKRIIVGKGSSNTIGDHFLLFSFNIQKNGISASQSFSDIIQEINSGQTKKGEWIFLNEGGEQILTEVCFSPMSDTFASHILVSITQIAKKSYINKTRLYAHCLKRVIRQGILNPLNNSLDLFAKKIHYSRDMAEKVKLYESILDAIPLPISATDPDKNWIYVNTATCRIIGKSRDTLLGKSCMSWNTPACNTSDCPFEHLKEGNPVTDINRDGKFYRAHCSFIHDSSGNNLGMMEVLVNVTPLQKISEYMKESIRYVTEDIQKLADGRVDLQMKTAQSDEYTEDIERYFSTINEALHVARFSLSTLMEESTYLASAAVDGFLQIRADPDNYKGDFRKIIEGINKTLDSILLPINEAMRVSDEYAKCNFTARVDPALPFNEDWSGFKSSLDNIGIQVSRALVNVGGEISNLTTITEKADHHIREIAYAAENLVQNVEHVSRNAELGNQGIASLHRTMDDFSITLNEVSDKAEQVSALSVNSNALAKKGTELAYNAETGMKVITQSGEELTHIISDIQEDMAQIGKIVQLITEISSQTNILALNASIEASRAGEFGRGFSVVAGEVKALANQSRQSAETITEMIHSLQKNTEKAYRAVSLATDAVFDGSTSLHETLQVFSTLAHSVDEISNHMEQVASMSEQQAASILEITNSAEKVAELIDETSNSAVDSAGLTGKTATELEQVASMIEQVRLFSTTISHEISNFKTSHDDSTP